MSLCTRGTAVLYGSRKTLLLVALANLRAAFFPRLSDGSPPLDWHCSDSNGRRYGNRSRIDARFLEVALLILLVGPRGCESGQKTSRSNYACRAVRPVSRQMGVRHRRKM